MQIKGTAMGTPVAPAYANIVLFSIEDTIFRDLDIFRFFRFLDDLFVIVNRDHADILIHRYNNNIPGIKLEAVTKGLTGIFLDISIFTLNGSIEFKLYQKETNKYQFLHPLSNHPPHVIRNWITEESRRIRNRCSRTLDADLNIIRFQARLANRGYGWPTIDYLTSVDRLADFVTHPKSGNLQFKGRQQTVFNLIVRLPDTVKCIPWESIKSIPLNVLDMLQSYSMSTSLFIGKGLSNVNASLS